MNCTIRVAKTKAVTAKLICVFVFAYADCWFSHGTAHIIAIMKEFYDHAKYLAYEKEEIIIPLITGNDNAKNNRKIMTAIAKSIARE